MIGSNQIAPLEWLIQKYEEEKAKLEKAERYVIELQKNVESFKRILQIASSQEFSDSAPKNTPPNHCIEENSTNSEIREYSGELPTQRAQRSPMDMLKPEFAEMSMFEVAETILATKKRPMEILEITQEAYVVEEGTEDFKRAKDSMSATLKDGFNQGRWTKTKRGVYALHQYADAELKSSQNGSEQYHNHSYADF